MILSRSEVGETGRRRFSSVGLFLTDVELSKL
jgi:hypothetical protein